LLCGEFLLLTLLLGCCGLLQRSVFCNGALFVQLGNE
jgi:hypothetical protein